MQSSLKTDNLNKISTEPLLLALGSRVRENIKGEKNNQAGLIFYSIE